MIIEDTSQHTGIFSFLVGFLVWVGTDYYKPPVPYDLALLGFGFLGMFIGVVLIVDWIAALAIHRFYQYRKTLEIPYKFILEKIEKLDPVQARLLSQLDWLEEVEREKKNV